MPIRSDDPSPISCGPNILDIQETAKYTPRHKKEVLINYQPKYTPRHKKEVLINYAEVTADKVTVLIETAEKSDEIDKERAQRAKDNAESKLNQLNKEDVEFEVVRAALTRAMARLSAAEKQ